MKIEPNAFDDDRSHADKASDARAEADYRAGRVVPHAKVVEWLATWGTNDETAAPDEWLQ